MPMKLSITRAVRMGALIYLFIYDIIRHTLEEFTHILGVPYAAAFFRIVFLIPCLVLSYGYLPGKPSLAILLYALSALTSWWYLDPALQIDFGYYWYGWCGYTFIMVATAIAAYRLQRKYRTHIDLSYEHILLDISVILYGIWIIKWPVAMQPEIIGFWTIVLVGQYLITWLLHRNRHLGCGE